MEKIPFNDWKKVDLRVAKIKTVQDHPNAEKLYLLLVELGEGESDIQLVAGLKQHYKKDQLVNQKVIIIKNLEPSVIRGIESQGMILAAVNKDKVTLISPNQDIESGSKIE